MDLTVPPSDMIHKLPRVQTTPFEPCLLPEGVQAPDFSREVQIYTTCVRYLLSRSRCICCIGISPLGLPPGASMCIAMTPPRLQCTMLFIPIMILFWHGSRQGHACADSVISCFVGKAQDADPWLMAFSVRLMCCKVTVRQYESAHQVCWPDMSCRSAALDSVTYSRGLYMGQAVSAYRAKAEFATSRRKAGFA